MNRLNPTICLGAIEGIDEQTNKYTHRLEKSPIFYL